jgi:hypothetical protein
MNFWDGRVLVDFKLFCGVIVVGGEGFVSSFAALVSFLIQSFSRFCLLRSSEYFVLHSFSRSHFFRLVAIYSRSFFDYFSFLALFSILLLNSIASALLGN